MIPSRSTWLEKQSDVRLTKDERRGLGGQEQQGRIKKKGLAVFETRERVQACVI